MSPRAAAFARQVVPAAGPGRPGAGQALLWAAAKLADYGIRARAGRVPQVLLHPSVIERFAASAPGLSGVGAPDAAHQPAVHRPPGGPGAGARPDAPLPRERAKAPYSPAEIAGFLALADAQPTLSRRMRAAGLVCLGAGAGLIRRGPARRPRHRRDLPLRRGDRRCPRRQARGRCRSWPATTTGCWPRRSSPGRAGHRRERPGAPEHHHPADPLAGRRDRAAPAGHRPAAGDLAGRLRRSCSAWPRSCTPPGSPAPSGSATCSPRWTRPMRPTAVALLGATR